MAITYMQRRRSGIYEFRRMLPRALAGKPMPAHARRELAELLNAQTERFKGELTVSLHTTDPTEGKRRDIKEGARVDALFAAAERLITNGPQSSSAGERGAIDLEELRANVLAELLAADAAEREDGDDRRRLQTAAERAQWPDLVGVPEASAKGMLEDHLSAHGEVLADLQADYRNALARRDPKIVDAELRVHLKRLGVPIDPPSPWYREAGLAVLQAHVKAYDLLLKRQAGDDVPTPEVKATAVKGINMAEAFDAWKAGSPARGSKRPSESTVREAERAVRRFKEMFGSLPVGELTRDKARAFRDALARVPTRLPAKVRTLPIQELLKAPGLSHLPSPHSETINKALNLLSGIVSNAERNGLLDAWPSFVNPFGRGIKLSTDARDAEGRQPFSAADMASIFTTKVYTTNDRPRGGGGEAAYWLPLIALFTGARQGEIAQLRISDLRLDPETSVWLFNISTEGGRTIKTASSRRKVPMHPALEAIGLLRYRQSLLDAGQSFEAPLWPDVKADREGRRGGPWSKWFNRYLRVHAKIASPDKVFHSFRHTWERVARDALMPEDMRDAVTGHTGGGTGRDYGNGFGLKALAEAVSKLPAPGWALGMTWLDPS